MEEALPAVESPATEIRRTVEQIAARKGVRVLEHGGRVLFAMVAGSVAFNLALPSSDRDYFAVYASDTQGVLGLTRPVASVDSHDPDLQMYEAARYCELLLKGNPKVIEPLFAEHFTWQSEEWIQLKKLRHHFMTQVVVDQYVSYALSQVKDYLEGRGAAPPAKKFYHAMRLMQEAHRIITNGAPRVWYEDGDEERQTLLAIRKGEKEVDTLVDQLHALREEMNVLKTRLPEKTNPSVLNEWLVFLRDKLLVEPRSPGPAGTLDSNDADAESLALRDRTAALLNRFGVEGHVLCCIPSGSRAHGLSEDSSEEDYIAVYVAPTAAVIGLSPPPLRVDESGPDGKQRETYARGMLVLEVGHACQLLVQGNHRLLEAMFLDPEACAQQQPKLVSFETSAWRDLRKKAGNVLIAQPAFNHYIGVAQGQLQARPFTRAHLFHAMRLLAEAEHIVEHRAPPRVTLSAEQGAFLRRIRNPQPGDDASPDGEYSLHALCQRAKEQATALAARKNVLPRSVDRGPLDRWLSSLRSSLLAA